MSSYRNRHRTRADLEIGLAMAEARVNARLSQTAAAEALTEFTGVLWTQTTVSNLETGRTPATVSQVVALTIVYTAADPFDIDEADYSDKGATTVLGRAVDTVAFTEPCVELDARPAAAPRVVN